MAMLVYRRVLIPLPGSSFTPQFDKPWYHTTRLVRNFNSKSWKLWRIPRTDIVVLLPRIHWSLYLTKNSFWENHFQKILLVERCQFLYYHILLAFQHVWPPGKNTSGTKKDIQGWSGIKAGIAILKFTCHLLKWISSIISHFFFAPHPTFLPNTLKDSMKHVAHIADWQLLRHHYANVDPRRPTSSSEKEPRKELGIYVYVMKTRGWEVDFLKIL